MKKIILNIVFALILFSCDDILEMTPKDKIAETEVWSDEALTQAYVNSCYLGLNSGYPILLGAACDEIYDVHDLGSFYTVLRGDLTADNISGISERLNFWSTAYSNIRNINIFFENIDDAPINDQLKQVMKGEMKFIHAYIYASLIWRYGGVPIINNIFELNDDYSVPRDSYDNCVDFICTELDEAIGLLPDKQPDSDSGRASADAAKALKSRVLLYAASPLNNANNDLSKWERAADAAEVLLHSDYSLYSDYQKLFLQDNDEIIFARYFTQANSTPIHQYWGRNGSHGWGMGSPTQNLVSDYEMINGELPFLDNGTVNARSGYDPANPYVNRDPRFYASVLYDGSLWMGRETETYTGGLDSRGSSIEPWNASFTGFYIKKYMPLEIPPTGSTEGTTSPWIFFRFAEILLNYAEAKYELGDEVTARKYVNMVRARDGVQMPPVTATGDELREKIHHERRIELALEDHRYFDVRRWKIAPVTENKNVLGITIKKLADGSKTYEISQLMERSFDDKNYLLPIPRAEIDRSLGALTQNPGYN